MGSERERATAAQLFSVDRTPLLLLQIYIYPGARSSYESQRVTGQQRGTRDEARGKRQERRIVSAMFGVHEAEMKSAWQQGGKGSRERGKGNRIGGHKKGRQNGHWVGVLSTGKYIQTH